MKHLFIGLLFAFALFALIVSSVPSVALSVLPANVALIGGNATIAVTATSARVVMPASVTTFPVAIVVNVGAKEAFVRATTVAGSAVTSDLSVPAGAIRLVYLGANTYIAAICGGSDSTTIRIAQANGVPYGWGGP